MGSWWNVSPIFNPPPHTDCICDSLLLLFFLWLSPFLSWYIEKCPIRRKTSSLSLSIHSASFSNYVISKWKITSHLNENWITTVIKLWTGKLHLLGFSLFLVFCWLNFYFCFLIRYLSMPTTARLSLYNNVCFATFSLRYTLHKHRAHHLII